MTSQPAPKKAKSGKGLLRRGVKVLIAGGIVTVGAYAVLSEQGFVASDNAVVSGYTASVRAPIEGYVSGLVVDVGSQVRKGTVLASIENPRVNDEHVTDLRELAVRFTQQEAAAQVEISTLEKMKAALDARAAAHTSGRGERLAAQLAEASQAVDAKKTRRDQARREVERRQSLARVNAGAPADAERAQADFDVANREMEAAQAHLDSIKVQGTWSARGITTDESGNDVAYSTQRSDEVGLRIADLRRQLADLAAQHTEATGRLADLKPQQEMLKHASLTAPQDGMIWRLGASDGEHLGTGDMATEIVDCTKAFIIAAVPQDRFPDIEVGAMARFRFSGERAESEGKVMSITGVGSIGRDRHVAATPAQTEVPNVMVVVQIPSIRQGESECLIGRTARVLIPVSGGGIAERIVRRFL